MNYKMNKLLKEPSQRQLKIGEEIKHLLSQQLIRKETHIKELDESSIMVSQVSVSPDMSNARVYIMTLLGNDINLVVSTLNQHCYIFQNKIASKTNFKKMPKLIFTEDKSFDHADKISKIFNKITKNS